MPFPGFTAPGLTVLTEFYPAPGGWAVVCHHCPWEDTVTDADIAELTALLHHCFVHIPPQCAPVVR